MKKLSVISATALSLCFASAGDLPNFLLDGSVQFQTETINRGRKEGQKSFTLRSEGGVKVFDAGEIYFGVKATLATRSTSDDILFDYLNTVSPHIGCIYDVTNDITIDAGFRHNFYTAVPKDAEYRRSSSEVYAGVIYDALVSPSIYGFYDFNRKEFAIEGNVAYTFDLSSHTIDGLGIKVGAKLGYDTSKKPYGAPYDAAWGSKGYAYYGFNADLVYSFSEQISARVGVNYCGNSAKKTAWVNQAPVNNNNVGRRNAIWLSTAVDCSF
jgi:hypothetical protein